MCRENNQIVLTRAECVKGRKNPQSKARVLTKLSKAKSGERCRADVLAMKKLILKKGPKKASVILAQNARNHKTYLNKLNRIIQSSVYTGSIENRIIQSSVYAGSIDRSKVHEAVLSLKDTE